MTLLQKSQPRFATNVAIRTAVFMLTICFADGAEEGSCEAPPADASYATNPPCYFPTEFLSVPVRAVREETHNSKIITFGLPNGVSLNHVVSSAIMMNAPGYGKNGKDVARPYNPISRPSQLGTFDLLVKVYDDGSASKYAGSLKPGEMVAFKQIKGNVKPFQYPFKRATITMIAGGTGIAPMIQALYLLMETPGEATKVRLLYGNVSPADIMLKTELDALASANPERLQITYVVGSSADDTSSKASGWVGEMGWVDEEKVRRLAFPPAEDTVVWICGVDDMYVSLAGSRMKPLSEGSVLHQLGYTPDMVWRS